MSEFDKDDGAVEDVPTADESHPDNEVTEIQEAWDDAEEPEGDEEELADVDDLDFDSVDVENVPVLAEGDDD